MEKQTEVKTAQEFFDWHKNVFMPWKSAMNQDESTKQQWAEILQKYRVELKQILTLLIEKREKEATQLWNSIKSAPRINDLSLDLSTGVLTVIHEDNGQEIIQLTTIIDALTKNNLG